MVANPLVKVSHVWSGVALLIEEGVGYVRVDTGVQAGHKLVKKSVVGAAVNTRDVVIA